MLTKGQADCFYFKCLTVLRGKVFSAGIHLHGMAISHQPLLPKGSYSKLAEKVLPVKAEVVSTDSSGFFPP